MQKVTVIVKLVDSSNFICNGKRFHANSRGLGRRFD